MASKYEVVQAFTRLMDATINAEQYGRLTTVVGQTWYGQTLKEMANFNNLVGQYDVNQFIGAIEAATKIENPICARENLPSPAVVEYLRLEKTLGLLALEFVVEW